MAKTNYRQAKRNREAVRKARQQQKLERKQHREPAAAAAAAADPATSTLTTETTIPGEPVAPAPAHAVDASRNEPK